MQSHKFVERHQGNRANISVIGQEKTQETWRLCKMNLAIRGIAHNLGDRNASTFTDDLHQDRKFDYIMANPPFNLKGWRGEDELLDDARWCGYGIPRASNANYAWILHIVSKLDVSHGIAGFLLANGALNDPDDRSIREQLLRNDKVEAIIVLPRDMFYTTDISVTLWIVNMNKNAGTVNGRSVRDRRGEVLFMDLRRWDNNVEEIVIEKGKKKKKTILTDTQIQEVKRIYNAWQSTDTALYKNVPELCQSAKILAADKVSPDDITIEDKGFSLAPSKYIEFIDHDLDIDYEKEMARIQGEMRLLMESEEKSQAMLKAAFRGIGYGID